MSDQHTSCREITRYNGFPVIISDRSHIYPNVTLELIIEALLLPVQQYSHRFKPHTKTLHINLGRNIGESFCIPTSKGDKIVWAKRIDRGYKRARFVQGKPPRLGKTLTMVLKWNRDREEYFVATCYISSVQNNRITKEEFWKKYALVWHPGFFKIVQGSALYERELGKCP